MSWPVRRPYFEDLDRIWVAWAAIEELVASPQASAIDVALPNVLRASSPSAGLGVSSHHFPRTPPTQAAARQRLEQAAAYPPQTSYGAKGVERLRWNTDEVPRSVTLCDHPCDPAIAHHHRSGLPGSTAAVTAHRSVL
jgi:hypothetical protein